VEFVSNEPWNRAMERWRLASRTAKPAKAPEGLNRPAPYLNTANCSLQFVLDKLPCFICLRRAVILSREDPPDGGSEDRGVQSRSQVRHEFVNSLQNRPKPAVSSLSGAERRARRATEGVSWSSTPVDWLAYSSAGCFDGAEAIYK
jgi:hypothetical protein